MTPITDHTDHSDHTDPGGHGSLATLAHRGHRRGAAAVLDGARRGARRHQHRRTATAGALAAIVLAGTVGAGVLVLRDEPPPVTADSAGGGRPGAGSLVTDVRVEGHEAFDRIVVDLDGPVTPDEPSAPPASLPATPACQGPADLDQKEVGITAVRSAAAPTEDGLVAGLSGRRIAGGPYAHEVIPLCAAEGYVWLAVVGDGLEALEVPPDWEPGDALPPSATDSAGSSGTTTCDADDQVRIDVFTWPGPDDTLPSDEICPPGVA